MKMNNIVIAIFLVALATTNVACDENSHIKVCLNPNDQKFYSTGVELKDFVCKDSLSGIIALQPHHSPSNATGTCSHVSSCVYGSVYYSCGTVLPNGQVCSNQCNSCCSQGCGNYSNQCCECCVGVAVDSHHNCCS